MVRKVVSGSGLLTEELELQLGDADDAPVLRMDANPSGSGAFARLVSTVSKMDRDNLGTVEVFEFASSLRDTLAELTLDETSRELAGRLSINGALEAGILYMESVTDGLPTRPSVDSSPQTENKPDA